MSTFHGEPFPGALSQYTSDMGYWQQQPYVTCNYTYGGVTVPIWTQSEIDCASAEAADALSRITFA